jgi:hypothetical protein
MCSDGVECSRRSLYTAMPNSAWQNKGDFYQIDRRTEIESGDNETISVAISMSKTSQGKESC